MMLKPRERIIQELRNSPEPISAREIAFRARLTEHQVISIICKKMDNVEKLEMSEGTFYILEKRRIEK